MPEETAPVSSGTVILDGKEYRWSSPRLADLEEYEALVGSITDPKTVDSIKGRTHLISLCLRKHHPEILPGIVRTWNCSVFKDCWPMLKQAIPFWGSADDSPSGADPSAPTSPGSSSGSSVGSPAAPVASE